MKHTIILPDLGQTTSEAKVVRWLKAVGERLSTGEPLLEVETDKATMDVEAYVGGYLRQQLLGEGEIAVALSPVAILTDTADEAFEDEPPSSSRDERSGLAPVDKGMEALRKPPVPLAAGGGSSEPRAKPIAAAPAARLRAKELAIDLSEISGSGPNGLITKTDVEAFAKRAQNPSSPAFGAPDVKLLAAMASFTSLSKSTVPHFYATVDLDVSVMEEWRRAWNQAHLQSRITVNDCLVRAAARALLDSPKINVRFAEGRYVQQTTGDVLLVVGREPGLMLVPLHVPASIQLPELARRIRAAVESARQGRMPAADTANSPLLAISNLGMLGIREFAAILPPGCTAIIAIGTIREQLVLKSGQPASVKICSVTLSADHRVVDGIVAARFLERLQFHVKAYDSISLDT
jgi:pyruvate dehydrogenase E2 component (dihydrolipoamide acetyltransferase)